MALLQTAYQVLDATISHIESRALNRSRVDWNTERAQLLTDDLKGLPATAGVATGNGRIPLPDGSVLGLTQSSFLDRTGEMIPGRLTPDVGVEERVYLSPGTRGRGSKGTNNRPCQSRGACRACDDSA